MFKRWVILLLVLMALSAIIHQYNWEKREDYYGANSVYQECMDYLDTVDRNWTGVGDRYWERRCSRDNVNSDYNRELRLRDRNSQLSRFGMLSGFGIFVVLFLSFIGRWLVKGRLKWD
jgi:hypothetical protein